MWASHFTLAPGLANVRNELGIKDTLSRLSLRTNAQKCINQLFMSCGQTMGGQNTLSKKSLNINYAICNLMLVQLSNQKNSIVFSRIQQQWLVSHFKKKRTIPIFLFVLERPSDPLGLPSTPWSHLLHTLEGQPAQTRHGWVMWLSGFWVVLTLFIYWM